MQVLSQPGRHGRFFVGLMSGTSADGIDAVVARISGGGRKLRAELRAHTHHVFTPAFRNHILRACLHGTVAEICELNFVLGEHFARAALAVIRKAGLKPAQVTALGSHGQTIHHLPNAKHPSTLQIGEPCVIAERTGITTVADFRVRDVAAGGQGAPLVPYVDWALFTSPVRPRILQNLGGIGNLTFLPPNATLADVRAFDTGPGNMVLDAVVAELSHGKLTFDKNGQWAARGQVCASLLAGLMAHPFIARRPPKTTGREEFGEGFVRTVLASGRRLRLPDADIVATVTAFTAESIADACRRFVFPRLTAKALRRAQMLLAGGGALNPVLRGLIADRIAPAQLCRIEEFGMTSETKEALAFAILAHATLRGEPSNVVGATGARRAVVLGKVIPGN